MPSGRGQRLQALLYRLLTGTVAKEAENIVRALAAGIMEVTIQAYHKLIICKTSFFLDGVVFRKYTDGTSR
jgi:hypothetical protein